jgi:hypothetical protein
MRDKTIGSHWLNSGVASLPERVCIRGLEMQWRDDFEMLKLRGERERSSFPKRSQRDICSLKADSNRCHSS